MKKCPYCAEDIQTKAIKCKHCGEMLDTSKPTPTKKSIAKNRSNTPDSLSKINWKVVLYIIGGLMLIGGLSGMSSGLADITDLTNLITGLSIVLVCQSHTGLMSGINGKPRKIKEVLPLVFLSVLMIYVVNLPEGMIIENPVMLMPTVIYLFIYYKKKWDTRHVSK